MSDKPKKGKAWKCEYCKSVVVGLKYCHNCGAERPKKP